MTPGRSTAYVGIRPVALAVIRNGSRFARARVPDGQGAGAITGRWGGGHSLWGNAGRDAVRREIREEIGGEIEGVRHLGTLENIFEREGQPAHWIVFVFEAEFTERSW